MIKFSVITICRDAENVIKRTMDSVLKQSYKNIEYIICDGDSLDNTKKIILEVSENYCQDIKLYSEKDFGIYNAMNRGISRAAGNYIVFLNAGDEFYDCDVLKNIVLYIQKSKKDIYYGITQVVNGFADRSRIRNFRKEFPHFQEGLLQGNMPCHQSIVARTECLRSHYFNEKYQYRADFEWLVNCYKQRAGIEPLDIIISKYDDTGLTSRVKVQNKMKKETQQILEYYYPLKYRWYTWKEIFFG